MMRRIGFILGVVLCGCMPPPPPEMIVPVETEFALINFSPRLYLTAAIRQTGQSEDFVPIGVLIPPGAVLRGGFIDLLPDSGGCPERIDLRVHLFKRVNEDRPVGLDPDELIDPEPVASGQIDDVFVCMLVIGRTSFNITLSATPFGVSLRFPRGTQDTPDLQIRLFQGVNLPDLDPPPLLDSAPIAGQIIGADGSLQPGIGVLLRAGTIPGSDRLAVTTTDAEGRFGFERPPGSYIVEVFADCFCFRPRFVIVETPIDNIIFIADKTECVDPDNFICEEAPAP